MLLSLLLCLAVQAPASDAQIGVYITAPTRGGFVDTGKDIQDSVKDIRDEMKGMKTLRVVDRPEDADVVLTVVMRGVGSEAFATRTEVNVSQYRGSEQASTTTGSVYANTWWLSSVIQAGQYRKEFVGSETNTSRSSMGAWRNVAKRTAKEVEAWAVANAAQLRARRKPQ